MNGYVKLGIGIIVAGGIGTLIYLGVKKKADKGDKKNDEVPDSGVPGNVTPSNQGKPIANDNFPLTLGVQGPNVAKVQTALINIFHDGSVQGADGKLGPKTKAAIEKVGYSLPLSEKDAIALVSGVRKNSVAGGRVEGKVNGGPVFDYSNQDRVMQYTSAGIGLGYYAGPLGDNFIAISTEKNGPKKYAVDKKYVNV